MFLKGMARPEPYLQGCIELFDELIAGEQAANREVVEYFLNATGAREAWISNLRRTLVAALDKNSRRAQMVGIRIAIC